MSIIRTKSISTDKGVMTVTELPVEDEAECARLNLQRQYLARVNKVVVWAGDAHNIDEAAERATWQLVWE